MSFILEYQKCSEDCVYFIEKYLDIELYPYQKGMLWNFQENRFFLVSSCRQSGKTTILIYFMIWYSLFHPDKNSLLLFTKSDTAKYAFESIITRFKKGSSLDFFGHLSSYGTKDPFVTFRNGSRITFAGSETSFAIHGRRVDFLGMDEPAYIEDFEEMWPAVYPIVSSCREGRVILSGTRNKVGDTFDKIYKGSIDGTNGWRSMTVNWWDIPGKDLMWKKSMMHSCGEKLFIKEFTTDF